MTYKIECFECGRDTIIDGYILRVTNNRFETLFSSSCIIECINFMEKGGLCDVSCYKIEVMKIGE
jgi:hypothetical protein